MELKILTDREKDQLVGGSKRKIRREYMDIVDQFLRSGEDLAEITDGKRQSASISQSMKKIICEENIRGVVVYISGERVFITKGEYPANCYRKDASNDDSEMAGHGA